MIVLHFVEYGKFNGSRIRAMLMLKNVVPMNYISIKHRRSSYIPHAIILHCIEQVSARTYSLYLHPKCLKQYVVCYLPMRSYVIFNTNIQSFSWKAVPCIELQMFMNHDTDNIEFLSFSYQFKQCPEFSDWPFGRVNSKIACVFAP